MRLPDCFGKCGLARIAKKESSAPLVAFFGAGKPHFSFAKLWYFFFGWLESWSLFAAPQVASANTFPTVCAQNLQDQGCLLHGVHECLSLHWCWWPGELLCLFLSLHWCSWAGESLQGRPHRVSKKYADFRCQKWTLWTWQGAAPRATERSANVETLPLYIAKFWSVQTCNFFSVGSRTCIVSYSHFRKLHGCTLIFFYLFFGSKRREIDHIVIPSEVVCLRPYPPQFLKYGHVPPHPLHTMIPQSKIIILCSICTHTHRLCELQLAASQKCLHFAETWTLIFVSGAMGDAGSVTCTWASSGVEGCVWTAFTSTCHKEGSVFGPKKPEKLET